MVVELVGGCADGARLDVSEPPVHHLKIIKPSKPRLDAFHDGPVAYYPTPVEDYYFIPATKQYATTYSPQWRKYLDEERERISQYLAEEDDGDGTTDRGN